MTPDEYLARRSPRSAMRPFDRLALVAIAVAVPLPWVLVAWWLA